MAKPGEIFAQAFSRSFAEAQRQERQQRAERLRARLEADRERRRLAATALNLEAKRIDDEISEAKSNLSDIENAIERGEISFASAQSQIRAQNQRLQEAKARRDSLIKRLESLSKSGIISNNNTPTPSRGAISPAEAGAGSIPQSRGQRRVEPPRPRSFSIIESAPVVQRLAIARARGEEKVKQQIESEIESTLSSINVANLSEVGIALDHINQVIGMAENKGFDVDRQGFSRRIERIVQTKIDDKIRSLEVIGASADSEAQIEAAAETLRQTLPSIFDDEALKITMKINAAEQKAKEILAKRREEERARERERALEQIKLRKEAQTEEERKQTEQNIKAAIPNMKTIDDVLQVLGAAASANIDIRSIEPTFDSKAIGVLGNDIHNKAMSIAQNVSQRLSSLVVGKKSLESARKIEKNELARIERLVEDSFLRLKQNGITIPLEDSVKSGIINEELSNARAVIDGFLAAKATRMEEIERKAIERAKEISTIKKSSKEPAPGSFLSRIESQIGIDPKNITDNILSKIAGAFGERAFSLDDRFVSDVRKLSGAIASGVGPVEFTSTRIPNPSDPALGTVTADKVLEAYALDGEGIEGALLLLSKVAPSQMKPDDLPSVLSVLRADPELESEFRRKLYFTILKMRQDARRSLESRIGKR